MNSLHWYIVEEEQFSGYECDGHYIPHIVAAETVEQATRLFDRKEVWNTPLRAYSLYLPDISRCKKPFILFTESQRRRYK